MNLADGRRRIRSPDAVWHVGLSNRQRQVAQCVVQGSSNRDIAAALEISEKTVEKHVSHIFRKLGFTSRAQLAVYVVSRSASTD